MVCAFSRCTKAPRPGEEGATDGDGDKPWGEALEPSDARATCGGSVGSKHAQRWTLVYIGGGAMTGMRLCTL